MKTMLTLGRTLAASLLLGWIGCAAAQSLGAPAASVWIGQPLEMTVPARFAAEGGDECVHADVFYGDQRLAAGQVRATVIGTREQRRVRIESTLPIDEPVVTVSVRAGCASTITRSYTLLPEMPSESMLAAAARPAFATVGGPAALPSLRMDTAPRYAAAPRQRAPRATAAAAREAAAPPPRKQRSVVARAETAVRAPGARLRLEPIDIDSRTVLRVSASLGDPGGDAARRATAALLWQAINADPSELLRTSAMLQQLEGDLAQLRQAATLTRSEMTALRRRVDEAQPWYASSRLIQLLGLLVLAAATAVGVLWYRTRHDVLGAMPWFEPQRRDPADSTLDSTFGPQERTAAAVLPQPPALRAGVPDVPAQPVPVPAAPVAGRRPAQPPAQVPMRNASGPIDFELAERRPNAGEQGRASRGVLRVETLAATFEEVEFLASLGLGSDAMDVLKAYLQDSTSPAPLAFFELMRLCEQAEDPGALPTIRRRYARAFGMEAPPLEQVTAPVGLEDMKDLSARITAAWGRPAALEVIEESLFGAPRDGAPLTLQAGRDLICLYDLALALLAEAAVPQSEADADVHPLAPWARPEDPLAAQSFTDALPEADGGHHFALDVDLTAAPGPLPESSDPEAAELKLAPLLEELQEQARRDAQARGARAVQEQDAFSAAVASERVSRY